MNKDSYKFPYKNLETIKYIKIEELKKDISIKYKDCYSKVDKKISHLYTINDFV
jgi:hypothetical protein